MTQYPENSTITLLTGANDPDGDQVRVRRIDGAVITVWPHAITLPKGTITVTEFGAVTYDDGGSVTGHPADGVTATNGTFSYTLWDGVDESPVYQANVELSGISSTVTVADQTAEFGADTPAGQGGFRPVGSNGQAITLTSYQSLVSGNLGGYTPQISGGRLVFNQAGAPHGAVLRCAHAGGTIDLAVSEVNSARSAVNLQEAKTAIQSYIATNPTAKYSVILRHGTFQVGNHLSNLQMNCTAITGIGGTRGAPRNPAIAGGGITIRAGALGSGNVEQVLLTGQYNMNGSRGFHFKNIRFAHRTDTVGYHYEPEHKVDVDSVQAGNPTTITLAKGQYENTQVQPGDRLVCSNMTGGQWGNLNGIEVDVLSSTPISGSRTTVTVAHNSSGYGGFTSGQIRGALSGTEQFKCVYCNSNAGQFPLAIFEACVFDNKSYEPDPGLWPVGIETAGADEIAVVNCEGYGFQHVSKALGWCHKVWMVDNMFIGAYGDNFAIRTNRVIDGLLHKFPSRSITNVTGGNPARVTVSGNHGLSVGDTVVVRSVNGAGQANSNWFVHSVVNSSTIELAAKNGSNITPVNGSSWGNYTNGGTLYGPVGPEIWVEGNYVEHANEPQWKANHTDGVQCSSPNNALNALVTVYDNVFNLWTDNGIATQPILGKGGAADPTYHEGPIRGNFCVGSAVNHLFGGKARSGRTAIEYNVSVREPATFPTSASGTRIFADANPIVKNVVGKLMNNSPTPSVEDNLYVDQTDNNPSYNTVFAGTFVQGSDNIWRCPAIRGLTGDRDTRIQAIKALLTTNAPYKGYGPTGDPQSPYYTP